MKQPEIQQPWEEVKPPHQWTIEKNGSARCSCCNTLIQLSEAERQKPFPCITIHLAARLSQAKPALSPEAHCGYTYDWVSHHSLNSRKLYNQGLPIMLSELKSELFKMDQNLPRSHALAETVTIHVNCPDCLHPGQPKP